MAMTAVSNRPQSMDAEEFLAKTISILATSTDFRAAIDDLSRLANSHLARWCAVFTIANEYSLRRLVPAEGLYPLDLHAPTGAGYVLRTGEAQFVAEVDEEVLATLGLPAVETPFANGDKPSSCLWLPLVARGRAIGAIAFLASDLKGNLAGRNLPMAQAVANAAAVALDSADLCHKAQEANRLKDEFVAMVSHELRTPLTPMLGCIHLLRTVKLSESNFERALEMIERNAQAQLQIVEDLLDASRIVEGKLHLVMKSLQLAPVLEAAIESVRSSAEGKGLKILTTLEDIQQPIEGDAHRLQQIMWHLLSNAVKFTPSEGRIEVSMKSDGDYVLIQVADTGVGIPADFLPHIFDRFRQAGDAEAKLRSGLGLGLAIVRHLVELHHGSIEAMSAGRGCGAVFTLKLPFAARRVVAVGDLAPE
jgi:signal transduction histidine kinase